MGFDNGSRGRAKHQIFKAFLFNDLDLNDLGVASSCAVESPMGSAAGGRGQQPTVRTGADSRQFLSRAVPDQTVVQCGCISAVHASI